MWEQVYCVNDLLGFVERYVFVENHDETLDSITHFGSAALIAS